MSRTMDCSSPCSAGAAAEAGVENFGAAQPGIVIPLTRLGAIRRLIEGGPAHHVADVVFPGVTLAAVHPLRRRSLGIEQPGEVTLAAGKVATGATLSEPKLELQTGSSLGWVPPPGPPQATYHWCRLASKTSAGAIGPPPMRPHSRLPAQPQNAEASHQSTFVIGCCCGLHHAGPLPVARVPAAHARPDPTYRRSWRPRTRRIGPPSLPSRRRRSSRRPPARPAHDTLAVASHRGALSAQGSVCQTPPLHTSRPVAAQRALPWLQPVGFAPASGSMTGSCPRCPPPPPRATTAAATARRVAAHARTATGTAVTTTEVPTVPPWFRLASGESLRVTSVSVMPTSLAQPRPNGHEPQNGTHIERVADIRIDLPKRASRRARSA